jgi:hypothetical protein
MYLRGHDLFRLVGQPLDAAGEHIAHIVYLENSLQEFDIRGLPTMIV